MKRKVISMVLALVLCMGMTIPAIAGGGGHVTEINYWNADNHEERIENFPEYDYVTGQPPASFVIERPDGTLFTGTSSYWFDPISQFFFPNDELLTMPGIYTLKEYPVQNGYQVISAQCRVSYAEQAEESSFTVTEEHLSQYFTTISIDFYIRPIV